MGNVSDSCEASNISRGTYYLWMKDDPEFAQKIAEIDESFVDLAESALRKNIKSGIQKAIEFALTNLKKDKYSNNQNINFTIPKIVKETVFVQTGEPPKIIEDTPEQEK